MQNIYRKHDKYTFTDITIEDEEKIQDLCTQCNDYFLTSQGKPISGGEAKEMLKELPPNKDYIDKINIGVYNSSNDIVGFVDLIKDYPNIGNWIIGLLLITPGERRSGLGKIIHNEILNIIIKNHGEKISLGVILENEGGLLFWKSIGYSITGKSDTIINGLNKPIYFMEYIISEKDKSDSIKKHAI